MVIPLFVEEITKAVLEARERGGYGARGRRYLIIGRLDRQKLRNGPVQRNLRGNSVVYLRTHSI